MDTRKRNSIGHAIAAARANHRKKKASKRKPKRAKKTRSKKKSAKRKTKKKRSKKKSAKRKTYTTKFQVGRRKVRVRAKVGDTVRETATAKLVRRGKKLVKKTKLHVRISHGRAVTHR